MPNTSSHIDVDLRAIAGLPEMQPGARNHDFGEAQSFLKRFGYLAEDAPVTPGVLDAPTEDALRRFQETYHVGLPGTFDRSTRDFMATDRCGMPDNALGFSTRCAWPRRNLTFAFGPLSSDVSADAARTSVRNAFTTWQAAGAGLSFTEVQANQNPDIMIEWRIAADPDHSMVGGVLAHADFPLGCSVVVDNLPLPVHFDDEEHTWSVGAATSAFDIETVALHEIGHILGLQHSSVAGAVMFPTVQSNFTLRTLRQDDLDGVRSLYPSQLLIRPQVVTGGNADGRLEVYSIGVDDAVWHAWQPAPSAGPWSGWNSLGGGVKQVLAQRNADGRLELFAIGMDNAVWNNWQPAPSSGPWSGWHSLGGGLKQIAVGQNADGRLELFGIGLDNAVWNNWQPAPSAGPWSGWHSLGGGLKRITVSRNADGRLEVFGVRFDDRLWHTWQAAPSSGPWSGPWSGWHHVAV